MKKRLLILLVLGPLMVAAGMIRRWQVATAFEPDTGLLVPHAPATLVMLGLLAVAVMGLLLLAREGTRSRTWRGYLSAFALPAKGLLVVYVAAGACLVAAGVLELRVWAQGPESAMSRLLCGVTLIPGGVCVGLVGWLNGQRREAGGRFAWPLLGPGVCGCLWLIRAYQTNTAIPNVMTYLFYFLGIICALLAAYDMAAFSFEKPKPKSFLWYAGMGLVLLSACLGDFLDQGAYIQLLLCLGYLLYLAGQLCCFVVRLDEPARVEPWCPPQEGQDVENEVTGHE